MSWRPKLQKAEVGALIPLQTAGAEPSMSTAVTIIIIEITTQAIVGIAMTAEAIAVVVETVVVAEIAEAAAGEIDAVAFCFIMVQ
ncbi:hypothetical protein EMIT07CA2_50303 [Brevibacillus sp. IT-7CA2]